MTELKPDCPRCTELEAENELLSQVINEIARELACDPDNEKILEAIAQQAERIKELETLRGNSVLVPGPELKKMQEQLAAAEKERDELAAQNQQMRSTLQWIQKRCAGDALPRWENTPQTRHSRGLILYNTNYALALTDLASPVLNKVKAELLRKAADEISRMVIRTVANSSATAEQCESLVREMADAIEKGEG